MFPASALSRAVSPPADIMAIGSHPFTGLIFAPVPNRSVDALTGDLARLGVASGDLLMVHASLRAVGPVEGGAEGVIGALEGAVGPEGTLLMTLGARDDWGWVNEKPEAERPGLLAGSPAFDPLLTPADPDVGVLAEVFRAMRGTLVSDHPEGRFGARGQLAAELLRDVPWHDYYGPGSPLERLVRNRGRILRLGAGRDTVTALHYAEYLAAVPNKRRVRRLRLVVGAAGPQLRWVECLDDSDGIVDRPGEDYFVTVLHSFLESGAARSGLVGRAAAELFEAADIVAFGAEWMSTHLA
jgi:aminoglycoside N3'-acetyltransferase